MTEKILGRAEELENSGFGSYDVIHLASAEQAEVDIFLTTDDRLQNIASRSIGKVPFVVINPVKWLEEILK